LLVTYIANILFLCVISLSILFCNWYIEI
jgi:hypothetical protein